MKQTRTKKSRRLGGSNGYTRRIHQSKLTTARLDKWRKDIGTTPKIPKRKSQLSPLSPPHTTSTRHNLSTGKLLGLATLVALGSIPGSDAALHRSEWLPQATHCVKHSGKWNAIEQKCTGQAREASSDMGTVAKGLNCVKAGNSFGPLGYCNYRFSKPK